ncbi:MAG: hypothetical protein P0Y59_20455 [Candidatus Sphingomonas phytovorans]|nr:hypothetical protein [Sphingomonas sp.]WEJ99278.1 MAG: hypothetical protein P0Y59_20455 [Sphingomonas sp.]
MSNVSLLRIHTDETARLGNRKVLEVVASPARVRRRHVPESDRAVVVDILGGIFAQGRRG